MAISIRDLKAAADRAREAAEAAGELRPTRIGPIARPIPASLRTAITEDLASGEYQRAASEAVAGDPELAEG